MNTSYRREFDTNYLVIEDESFSADRYTLKMLAVNRPGAFLELSVKQMNGMTLLWYRITSMQSAARLFERRPLGGRDIIRLLDGYREALDQARAFLLDPGDIVLDPEYVFMAPDREEVRFIYVPGQEELLQSSLKKLLEYILRKLDHKDAAAVELGYAMYEAIAGEEKGFLDAWEQLGHVREDGPARLAQAGAGADDGRERRIALEGGDTQDEYGPGPGVGAEGSGEAARGRAGRKKKGWKRESRDRGRGKDTGKGRSVLAAVGIAATALAFGLIGWFTELDPVQTGGLFFGTVAAAWLVYSLVRGEGGPDGGSRRGRSVSAGEDEFWDALMQEDNMEVVESGRDLPFGVGDRHAAEAGAAFSAADGWRPRGRNEMPPAGAGKSDPASRAGGGSAQGLENEAWIHGETRALGEVDRRARLVLVSQDIRRSRDLVVESAITLIGKSRELADVIIPLNIVSRVHARLDSTKEGIFLTDLNSMNGTFVNEKRLEPNQRVQVSEGDRISFATVHFKLSRRDY